MLTHFEDGRLVFLKLQIFLLYLVNSDTNNVDHVSEDGSSDYLNHCHNDSLYEIVGCEVSVANSDHGCIGPIVRVNVVDVPRFVGYLSLIDPSKTVFGAEIGHWVHDKSLYKRKSYEEMGHSYSKAK